MFPLTRSPKPAGTRTSGTRGAAPLDLLLQPRPTILTCRTVGDRDELLSMAPLIESRSPGWRVMAATEWRGDPMRPARRRVPFLPVTPPPNGILPAPGFTSVPTTYGPWGVHHQTVTSSPWGPPAPSGPWNLPPAPFSPHGFPEHRLGWC